MSKFAVDLPEDEFARIFGNPDRGVTGRSRLCRVCGGWHRMDKPWPHNCRREALPRADLASPMVAPPFMPFRTGQMAEAVIINDRREKADYMERHDLAEYDSGIEAPREPTDREWQVEFVADFKRQIETDPLNRPPVERVGETDTEGAGDIATDDIEVFK